MDQTTCKTIYVNKTCLKAFKHDFKPALNIHWKAFKGRYKGQLNHPVWGGVFGGYVGWYLGAILEVCWMVCSRGDTKENYEKRM